MRTSFPSGSVVTLHSEPCPLERRFMRARLLALTTLLPLVALAFAHSSRPVEARPITHAPVVVAPAAATGDAAPIISAIELASLGSGLLVPVVGVRPETLRDGFTERRVGHVHEAIDIMAPRGTPIVSAA